MSKQKKRPQPFPPGDLDTLLRARREKRLVSFASGKPAIVDSAQREYQSKRKMQTETPQVGGETASIKPGSLISPIEDVLMMAETLELFAAHCSERLSDIEHRREDCTHLLEPQHDENGNNVNVASDEMVLAIGKKLQRIGAERRNIKNRFEVIKAVKRGFSSEMGQECLAFLRNLLAEAATITKEQKQRMYTPRTDELDNLFDAPLPKYIDCKSIRPDVPDEAPEDPGYDSPLSCMSEAMLTQLLHEYEELENMAPQNEVAGT